MLPELLETVMEPVQAGKFELRVLLSHTIVAKVSVCAVLLAEPKWPPVVLLFDHEPPLAVNVLFPSTALPQLTFGVTVWSTVVVPLTLQVGLLTVMVPQVVTPATSTSLHLTPDTVIVLLPVVVEAL